MASVITYNDFRYGMVSEYMRRRVDLESYQKSARLLENMVPMRTGGVRLRPGTVLSFTPAEGTLRIIPFTISVREHYLLTLAMKRVYIYGLDVSGKYVNISGEGFVTKYSTADEIREIQFAQDYEKVILVQRNHPPFVIQKSSNGGWSAADIALDAATSAYNYTYDDEGNEIKSAYTYDYNGLFTDNNFPSVVAFNGSRLWMGGPTAHPYRIWASRPFEHFNFQTKEYYNYTDDAITTEQYLDAINGAGETSEIIKQPVDEENPGEIWRVSNTVDQSAGAVISVNGIYEYSVSGEQGTLLGHREYDANEDTWGDPVYDGKTWTYSYQYTKPVQKLDSTTTEDCALMLDMAGNRDETISWLAVNGDYIFVGTASSEKTMPSSINGLNQVNSPAGAYGSAPFIQSCYGVRNIFYVQAGGKLLRSITTSSDGIVFKDETFQCSDILAPGVVELAWQRVPEPRLFALLKDGSLAVLCYDTDYGVQAWCIWRFKGLTIKSIAIVDVEEGQEIFLLAEDTDGDVGVVGLEDGVYTDWGGGQFIGVIETSLIDSASTMMYTKKGYNVAVDSMGTRFKVRAVGSRDASSFKYPDLITKIPAYTVPSDKGLSYRFESFGGEDMVLLALMIEAEVTQ